MLKLSPVKKLIAGLFLFLLATLSFGGNENNLPGARTSGMGYCGLTLTDIWGVQHNQANLGFISNYSAGAYYENRFGLKETGFKNVGAMLPVGNSNGFLITANQFGYSQYTEAKYGLGYGRKLGEGFGMGIQINYNSMRFGDIYGKKQSLTAELGIRAKLLEKLTFGAHIYNFSRTLLTNDVQEYIPTTIRTGIEYTFSESAKVLFENESSINYKTNFRLGIEYTLKQKVYLRTGVNTYPFSAGFGFGYKYKTLQMDVAANYHQVLGFSPGVSLHVNFGKNKTIEKAE